MKKFLIPKRIIEIILIIAAVIASIYVFSVIIDGAIDIANYDPNIEGSTDPKIGLAIVGVILFAVGVYYAAVYAAVGLIPIILAIVNNSSVKKTGKGKRAALWWPILLAAWTPGLLAVLYLFLMSLSVIG